jgi:hypothetical protein
LDCECLLWGRWVDSFRNHDIQAVDGIDGRFKDELPHKLG